MDLELPFDPGDHKLQQVLLKISGVSIGYIHLHENRGALPYHLPWWCTTLYFTMEVMQVDSGCFYLVVWLLGIIESLISPHYGVY